MCFQLAVVYSCSSSSNSVIGFVIHKHLLPLINHIHVAVIS